MRLGAALLLGLGAAASGHAGETDTIDFASVMDALAALRANPDARFQSDDGWTVVADRENGRAVLWFFTPESHPAHPSVVKRTVVDRNGIGYIDVAALCQAPQDACNELLSEFRQAQVPAAKNAIAREMTFDIGIRLNDHHRVRITRLVAEDGKAAEIRMDDVFKVVFVPTLDAARGVVLWAALYEFSGGDYRLLSEPRVAMPADGTANIELASVSGGTFRFSVTPVVAAR